MKQSHDHTNTCIAPEVGALLMQYELRTLSQSQIDAFERHLMNCDFCLSEAEEMRKVANAMLANRTHILSAYSKDDVTVDSLLEQAAGASKPSPHVAKVATPRPRVFSWEHLFGPRAAIAFAAAAALFLVIGLGIFDHKQPATIGEYDPPAWHAWQTRSSLPADSLLMRAHESYSQKDFVTASQALSQYLTNREDSQAALYLAVSYYETDRFDAAIKALARVGSENSVVFQEAEFYRALTHIRLGENDRAIIILKKFVATNSTRMEPARELLQQLGE